MIIDSPIMGKFNKADGVTLRYKGRTYIGRNWDEAYAALRSDMAHERLLSLVMRISSTVIAAGLLAMAVVAIKVLV